MSRHSPSVHGWQGSRHRATNRTTWRRSKNKPEHALGPIVQLRRSDDYFFQGGILRKPPLAACPTCGVDTPADQIRHGRCGLCVIRGIWRA